MSRIDELIEQLCPDGVEFFDLREVAAIQGGKDYKHLGKGDVPVYGSGGIMTYVDGFSGQGPSVLLPRKGSISNIFFVEGPFWIVDTIFSTQIDESRVLAKFFYYVLRNLRIERLNTSNAARPALTRKVIDRIRIPVPPLEVQREIVRILDLFTSLEAELEAELEARRLQYEHYRDQLLTFTEGGQEARWTTLGEIGFFKRGTSFQKVHLRERGIPCIHYGEIYTKYKLAARKTVSFLDPSSFGGRESAQPGSIVLATTSENDEDVAMPLAWLGEDSVVVSNDALVFEHSYDPLYLAHFFESSHFGEQKKKLLTGTKVKRISASNLRKVRVPAIDFGTQTKISKELESFRDLLENASASLPAEIAARRQQYEYYRDKLLTFKEKVG